MSLADVMTFFPYHGVVEHICHFLVHEVKIYGEATSLLSPPPFGRP